MNPSVKTLSFVLVSFLFALGCGDDATMLPDGGMSGSDAGVPDAATMDTGSLSDASSSPDASNFEGSRVRVLHASPDAPNVDVFVNGGADPAFANLAFGSSTGYANVPAGTYDFAVSPTGTTAGDAVISIDAFPLMEQGSYTFVAVGDVANIQGIALTDDASAPAAGNIRVRPVHAANGVGTVDVVALLPDGSSVPLAPGLEFGTAADALEVPAGQYVVGLDATADGIIDLTFELPALVAGTVVNVFATADTSGNVFLLAQLADGNTLRIDSMPASATTGTVRVLHFGPDAPNVDVFLNGSLNPIVSDLPFESGGSLELPIGTYRVDVSPTGASAAEAVITVDALVVREGEASTVVAYDRLAAGLKGLVIEDDLSTPADSQIRVRAIHVATGLTEVDVLNIPNNGLATIIAPDLDFGAVGDNLLLPAGAYRLGLDSDNNGTIDAEYPLPRLAAGTVANVFAVSQSVDFFLIAQFADGSTARINAD